MSWRCWLIDHFALLFSARNATIDLYCIRTHLVVNVFRSGSQQSEIKEGPFNWSAGKTAACLMG